MNSKQGWFPNIRISSSQVALVFITAVTAFSLSACGGKKDTAPDKAEEKNQSIVLSENGVGPINVTTSFNMHQITLAFANFNVIQKVNFQSGHPFPVISISEGVKVIMTIIPDATQQKIYSIIIEDNIISNSLGHYLGTSYSDVYPYGKDEECQPGSQDMAGKVLCYAPKTPNILYIFNGKKNVANDAIPPKDVLQGWVLESIIWRPKG